MKTLKFIRLKMLFILESLNLGLYRFRLAPPPIKKRRLYVELKERCLQEQYNREVEKNRRGIRGK